MADIRIVSVDAQTDAGLLDDWVGVETAAERFEFGDRHTAYSADEIRTRLRVADDRHITLLVAVDGDTAVGTAAFEVPLLDNLHLVTFGASVLPQCRRRGIGTLLLERITTMASAEGRSTLIAESTVAMGGDDPAAPFARRHGFTAELTEIRSDLDVPATGVDALLEPLEADAVGHAGDFDVLTWWDDVPAEWLEQRAHLSARMSTDAPSGGLDLHEEAWDVDRVRQELRVAREQGRRWVETVAAHRATGHLAAYTDLVVARHTPDMAYQHDTLVLREHRGRRLGQLVKATNLRALLGELPSVRRVVTWNAQVNEPMLRVNRAMGFRPVGVMTEWQKVLA